MQVTSVAGNAALTTKAASLPPVSPGKLLNADGTEAKGKEKSRLVKLLKKIFPLFHPDSPFRTFWNLFIMLLIFYCAFVRTRATAQSLLNLSLTHRAVASLPWPIFG